MSFLLWFVFITAVYIPLKLKFKPSVWVFGSSMFASPSFDNLSILGPPGYGRFIILATLSKASPIASSLVLPKISKSV